MDRISSQNSDDAELAMRTLSWITHALRPLTVSELQCALAVEPGASTLDEDALPDEDLFETVCAGLVIIDQESSIIRLVHYTAKEYFLAVRKNLFPTAERDIVASCISWLSFDVSPRILHPDSESKFRYACSCSNCWGQEHFAYASEMWPDHLRGNLEEDPSVRPLLLNLLSNPVVMKNMHHVVLNKNYSFFEHLFVAHCPLGLHFAAALSLFRTVDTLLASGESINISKDSGFTALHLSASAGLHSMVEYLLLKGAEIDYVDEDGNTALLHAVHQGHLNVARLLYEAGANIEARDNRGRTALVIAVDKGNQATGIDVLKLSANASAQTDETALHLCARYLDRVMMSLLLEQGVTVNSRNRFGTVLYEAARGDSRVVTFWLLNNCIDINAQDRFGATALDHAIRYAKMNALRALLYRGTAPSPVGDRSQDRFPEHQTKRIDCNESTTTDTS